MASNTDGNPRRPKPLLAPQRQLARAQAYFVASVLIGLDGGKHGVESLVFDDISGRYQRPLVIDRVRQRSTFVTDIDRTVGGLVYVDTPFATSECSGFGGRC